jgi:hypothetical protein
MVLLSNINLNISEKTLSCLIKGGYIDIYAGSFLMQSYNPDFINQYTFIARSTFIKTLEDLIRLNFEYG